MISFYSNLKPIEEFLSIYDLSFYNEVPEDWILIMTDIINSTEAIQKDQYKNVNLSTVFAIVSISNLLETLEFPFVYGGDGATILIPINYLEPAKIYLLKVKNLVKKLFNLDLRVGLISIKELKRMGYLIKVGKYKVSNCFYQALVLGDGLEFFEKEIKKGNYLLPEEEIDSGDIDLTGFSCRFQDVETTKDEVIALIIKIKDENLKEIYKNILSKIYEIYGEIDNWHPAQIKNLKIISLLDPMLNLEAKVTLLKVPYFIRRILLLLQLLMQKLIIKLPFKLGIQLNYQDATDLLIMEYVSADFKKIENSIKIVLSTTLEEKQKLFQYLDTLESKNQIVYGYFSEKKVHFICAVYINRKQDVHFIDVVRGGFTNAASMIKQKEKLTSFSEN